MTKNLTIFLAALTLSGCASSQPLLSAKPQEALLTPCEKLLGLSSVAHMGDMMQWMDDARVKHQTCAAKHKALVDSM